MHEGDPKLVLLTGAGGRLGAALAKHLRARDFRLRALVRDAQALPSHFESALEWRSAQSDSAAVDALLEGVSSIVHLASSGAKDERVCHDAHLAMPELLLNAAKNSSVSRFIALSSIKAIAGESHESALGTDSTPAPKSGYGLFKSKAERLLREHEANARLATFTLRLPMVYGCDAVGNFGALRQAARFRIPLPVAADNQRSLLFSENLFACIVRLLEASQAPGYRLVHLADGPAISTEKFFRLIAQAQGSPGWCVTLPGSWGQKLAGLPIVGGIGERLLGSLFFVRVAL